MVFVFLLLVSLDQLKAIVCCTRHMPSFSLILTWSRGHMCPLDIFFFYFLIIFYFLREKNWGRRDRMLVGFRTTCTIGTYHHSYCEFEPCLWRGVLDTTLCDKVCQWFTTGRLFSPGTPVSSTNKSDRHDIAEILLKVALNIIKPKPKSNKILIMRKVRDSFISNLTQYTIHI